MKRIYLTIDCTRGSWPASVLPIIIDVLGRLPMIDRVRGSVGMTGKAETIDFKARRDFARVMKQESQEVFDA